MTIRNLIYNLLWVLSCLPGWAAFQLGLLAPDRVQRRLLKRLLRRNKSTDWGLRHAFRAIRTVRAFQERHPLTTYETYRNDIDRIASGRARVLSKSEVRLLEPTSSSTGPAKLIPYTQALKRDFQRGIAPWVVDLYIHHPRLLTGRAYWAVSPIGHEATRTRGGTPIGFEDDAEYLGGFGKRLMRRLFAVPPEVKYIRDIGAFRYITLLFLLAARDLTLISVWNPTFLTLLFEPLSDQWAWLCRDIASGTIKCDLPIDDELRQRVEDRLQSDPARAQEIAALFCSSGCGDVPFEKLWPRLSLISCWADGQASLAVHQIRARFPNTPIQPKGLLATEGMVSFPLCGMKGAVPALRSHFFEFLAVGETADRPSLLHELAKGKRYEVVISTGGGFYRYRTNDVVEVVAMNGRMPLLRFVGREYRVSDVVGEKLDEASVLEVVSSVFHTLSIHPSFWMMAPERRNDVFGYVLFVEPNGNRAMGGETLDTLAAEVDRALQDAFHYRYARQLGQLGPVRVAGIDCGQERYMEGCVAFGQRLGDVKAACLDHRIGWSHYFESVRDEHGHQPAAVIRS
jgi:hypothetical protein